MSERRRGRFDSRGLGLDGSKRLARSNCAASERERPHACMPQGRGLHALGGVRVGTCARGLGGSGRAVSVCMCAVGHAAAGDVRAVNQCL